MVLFFRSKTVGFKQIDRTRLGGAPSHSRTSFAGKLRAIGAFGLTTALISAAKPIPLKADLRYEKTGKYDDNLDYDKRFKPAYLFLFSIMAQTAGAKLPSTQKSKPN
jgi:hypothetical protein